MAVNKGMKGIKENDKIYYLSARNSSNNNEIKASRRGTRSGTAAGRRAESQYTNTAKEALYRDNQHKKHQKEK